MTASRQVAPGSRVSVEAGVVPVGAYRLPPAGRDSVVVRRGTALVRLVQGPAGWDVVAEWQGAGAVRFRAEGPTRDAAAEGIARMRFALGTDHDIRPFLRRFRRDPLIGAVVRSRPWVRPRRRPEPFEALAWAVCEQLIESRRAASIERTIVRRHGRRSSCGCFVSPPA